MKIFFYSDFDENFFAYVSEHFKEKPLPPNVNKFFSGFLFMIFSLVPKDERCSEMYANKIIKIGAKIYFLSKNLLNLVKQNFFFFG